jgi:hypothetical protein
MRYFLAILLIALGAGGLPLRGQDDSVPPDAPPDAPSPRALESIDARQAMALANAWGARVQSSVTTEGVSFTFPDGFRRLVPMPDDQVVLAVAPYQNKTHPCETHTMSSCQGELSGVPVEVLAQRSDGSVLIHETVNTPANGFIELWLPRDLEVHLTLMARGLAAEEVARTYRGSNTCLTTLKLQ